MTQNIHPTTIALNQKRVSRHPEQSEGSHKILRGAQNDTLFVKGYIIHAHARISKDIAVFVLLDTSTPMG